MNIVKNSTSLGFVTGFILSLLTANAAAAINLSQSPLFLAEQVASNVMVMLDNSGSMKVRMYTGNYSNSGDYNGIFIKEKNYVYDPLIPVNTSAYPTMVDASSNTMIDSTATGAFVESNCTPAAGNSTCWSGRFLNWLTTRRIDASREVLVGGKLESRSSSNYSTATHTGLNTAYKIVANNERSDGNITDSVSNSDNYSPIPNNQTITISSPAENGDFKSSYDPYAKISALVNTPIYNSASDIIGEFGTVTLKENYVTVNLNKSYIDPIVVSQALSFNGGDPSVVRIKDVTTNSFKIKLQEWDYKDGAHTNENLSFVVIENGSHDLVGGLQIKTGKVNTDAEYVDGTCGSSRINNASVSYSSSFSSSPVIISSVMTENDADAINSRVWDISTSGFKLALQEEESPLTSGHSSETVGYIAISPGTVNDATNKFKLEAGKISGVTESNSTISYSSTFTTAPAFVAAIQTLNGSDTTAVRYNSNGASAAVVHIEEEKSCDNEVTHTGEDIGYFALQGDKTSFNLAVVVTSEPKGVLHDVKDDVRLGLSFYRFDPNKADMYNGVKTQGGTLRFKIPNNPYVKKPSDTATLPAAQQGFRELEGYIGTSFTDIVDAIEHYPLIWGTTPLAENLVEVINYFQQNATPYYPDMVSGFPDYVKANDSTPADKARDPYYVPAYDERLQCINSNVLIVTDGEPYRDADIDPQMVNYDGDTVGNDGNGDPGDGANSDPNAGTGYGKDNLDDVAYWAFCDTDGGTKTCKTGGKATVKLGGVLRDNLRDLRPDATNPDLKGNQFLKIDTIGFAGNSVRQILKDTADNAGGKAFAASDGASLKDALTEAFNTAAANTSASSVAANSTRLDSSTLIYQAGLDSGRWSGQLQAFGLNTLTGAVNALPVWHTDTFDKIKDDHTQRKIFTYNSPLDLVADLTTSDTPVDPSVSSTGIAFYTLSNFNTSQQGHLNNSQTLIDYLRGDVTNDGQAIGYRARPMVTKDPLQDDVALATPHRRILGDIVNSNPWFVGGDNFGYSTLTGDSGNEGSKYAAHLTATGNRTDMIYVGANDGMLHAFEAATGVEKFAFVPSTIIPDIAQLADPNYAANHKYFVDGSPRAGDVYYDSAWHTVLVGTTGAGGRGVFAIDVTDPDTFSASNVLWEFNNTNNDPDMGYTLSEPTIVRMANGDWAAIVGNGYKSDRHKAILYILDIKTGAVIKKIDTGKGDSLNPNGLSSHIPVDINGDRIVDFIYAGDLLGNVWKFDVSDSNTAQWKSIEASGSPDPLFTATDTSSNPQPITAKPQVGLHPEGGVMVYVGTGKYFEVGDNIVTGSPQVQTFYGLWDDLSNTPQISGRSELQVQSILAEASQDFAIDTDGDGINDDTKTVEVRVNSANPVNYNDTSDVLTNPIKKGWYIELESPRNGVEGERVVASPILRGRRIVFTTLIPNSNPCEFGGTSWLAELDGVTGQRLTDIAFDLNNDGLFTSEDLSLLVDTDGDGDIDSNDKKLPTSWIKTDDIIETPAVISDGEKEYKYASGTSGKVNVITESSGEGLGRQSWRQLR